jgi:hypothetical protein
LLAGMKASRHEEKDKTKLSEMKGASKWKVKGARQKNQEL